MYEEQEQSGLRYEIYKAKRAYNDISSLFRIMSDNRVVERRNNRRR